VYRQIAKLLHQAKERGAIPGRHRVEGSGKSLVIKHPILRDSGIAFRRQREIDTALVDGIADAKQEASLSQTLHDLGAGALGQAQMPDDVTQAAAADRHVAQDFSLVLAEVGIVLSVEGHPDRSVRRVEQFGI